MKILVACERSGLVRKAFRERGHEAYSCDLFPADDGGEHIQGDVRRILQDQWHLVIAFPPCTNLCVSGARWFKDKKDDGRQQEGIDFFLEFTRLDHTKRVAIENPIGIMSSFYRKPDQIIQPWQFGHGERKATCLWLKNLPPLYATTGIEMGREQRIANMFPSDDRGYLRSITYTGIAEAMAEQWNEQALDAYDRNENTCVLDF